MKRTIALLLALCLAACLPALAENGELFEPVVEEDASLPSGLKATWACVTFGSYPTREVVSGDYSAVEDYALREGDVISDAALYEQLTKAEWTDDETELDGARYRRMTAMDAVSWATDRPQHYTWDGPDRWHYFRYEPIKWRVIELNGSVATLLADRQLDCAPFNIEDADTCWADCTLRSFLNGYDGSMNTLGKDYDAAPRDSFIATAFSESERRSILRLPVENLPSRNYGISSGPDTEDYVFILSEAEVYASPAAARHGFYAGGGVDDAARRFSPTPYAMARGAWYSPVDAYRGNGFWFMRTTGYTAASVTYICDFGYIYSRGTYATCNDAALLPAIRVDLDTAACEYAGTVTSADIVK